MEEQEKIDIREHLTGWIDTLLKDGLVPQVVNPKAIRANHIPKSKVKEKIEEYKQEDLEIYDTDSEDVRIAKYEQRAILEVLQELMEGE